MVSIHLLDDLEIALSIDSTSKNLSREVASLLRDYGLKYDKSIYAFVGHVGDLTNTFLDRLKTISPITIDKDIDLDKIDEMIQNHIAAKQFDIKFYPRLLKLPPKNEKQEETIRNIIKYDSFFIDGDVGVGKTYMTIGGMNHFIRKNIIQKIIILTVPIVKRNWRYEMLHKFGLYFKESDFYIVDADKNRNPFQSDAKVIIMSHSNMHLLTKDYYNRIGEDLPSVQYFRKNKMMDDVKKWLNGDALMTVVDESHKLKNPSSWRFKSAIGLSELSTVRGELSGTKAPNGWIDNYAQMRFLSPKFVNNLSFADFKKDVAVLGTKYSKYAIKNYIPEKIEKWDRIWSPYVHRVEKEKVTDVITSKLLVDISPLHRQIYQSLTSDVLFAIREKQGKLEFTKVKNSFPYLLLSLADPIMIEEKLIGNHQQLLDQWSIEQNEKFKIVKELLVDRIDEEGEKVILWINNPKVIEEVAKKLSKYNPYVIHGQQKMEKGVSVDDYRDDIIAKINDPNDPVKLLIANPATIGTGANIIGANNVVYWNLSFDYSEISQARGRYDRYGQTKTVREWFLVAESTIDEIAFQGMLMKASLNKTKVDFSELTKEEYRAIFEGRFELWENVA